MDYLQKFASQVRLRLFIMLLIDNLIVLGDWWIADHVFHLNGIALVTAVVVGTLLAVTILPWASARYLTQPTQLIWQAILHIAPEGSDVPPPDMRRAGLGKELVANLISHVYQLANIVDTVDKTRGGRTNEPQSSFIANSLPLPLVVLDKEQNIVFANNAMLQYIQRSDEEVIGQNVYSVLDLSFTNDKTFDSWLHEAKTTKVTDQQSWERVRLVLAEQKITRFFDMAAYYNRSNPNGLESMIVLFDRTLQYSQDEQAMSFVALAVHELRTPLTLLRGYIEVFEDELGDKLNPELASFMHKMQAASQQLTAFTNNILNVSRFENDQLTLQLHEEDWPKALLAAVNDMRMRAQVQGIALKTEIAPNLPTVAIDALSIYEVVANLVDNAIKYSGKSKEIIIRAGLNREGLVETTVQDFGLGIPGAALPNLFDKFYRNHRNRAQVGGTGMGLYLSKAIVDAHSGHLWVQSKEGQGSTFGFTLLPYSKLADERKNSDNTDVTRTAHGWIKNHSLYRR